MRFLYSNQYVKQFKKQQKNLQNKIYTRLQVFIEDEFHPQLNNHQLHGKYSEYRSINITGDNRLLYKRISTEVVYLGLLGTHSELYE